MSERDVILLLSEGGRTINEKFYKRWKANETTYFVLCITT